MNIFKKYYEHGAITNATDLKKLYRSLVLKIHPDAAGGAASSSSFIKLQNDYEEFALFLQNKGAPCTIPYTTRGMLDIFTDIEATGFLLTQSTRKYTHAYTARLQKFNEMLQTYTIVGVSDIRTVEAELKNLRIRDRDCFDSVKLLIDGIISYHYERRAFVKHSILKLYGEYEKKIEGRSYQELRGFLRWLLNAVKLA